MYRIRSIVLVLSLLAISGLFNYELAAKWPRLFGDSLPGSQMAQQVENSTPWHEWTGLLPLDRLLHEGQEALQFYGLFLTGLARIPGLTLSQIGQ